VAGDALLSAFAGLDIENIAMGGSGSKAKKMRESLGGVTEPSTESLGMATTSSILTSSNESLTSKLTQPGYSPSSIPPKEDPILNLMTNLLMKHGNKEGARKIVLESLRELLVISAQPPTIEANTLMTTFEHTLVNERPKNPPSHSSTTPSSSHPPQSVSLPSVVPPKSFKFHPH
jgi:hypothetical protein